MSLYWSKDAKAYRLRNVYAAKTYKFREEILIDIYHNAEQPTEVQPGVSTKFHCLYILLYDACLMRDFVMSMCCTNSTVTWHDI